jgi:hypothetical protein
MFGLTSGVRSHRGVLGLFVQVVFVLCSCGRYLPPVPPERLAPKPLEFVDLVPLDNGIKFSWLSPTEDLQGEELKYLDEYRVYRKETTSLKDIQDEDIPWQLMQTIPETALKLLQQKRDEARSVGKPVRRVKLGEEERKVWYEDLSVERDRVYVYKVVTQSSRFGEIEPKRLVKVVFRGLESDIKFFNAARFDEEVPLTEVEQQLSPSSGGLF